MSVAEGRKIDWAARDKAGTLGRLGSYDFLDRVINIKLIIGTPSGKDEEVVLRSDFEAYDADAWKSVLAGGKPSPGSVRKCVVKPSIKVQYRQTGQNTDTQIDVYIDNFFTLASSNEMLMQFNSAKYPLRGFELHMGYFGQFASLYAAQVGGVPTPDQLVEMKAPNGGYVIKCSVDYVTTEKLPPDATLRIHGWVGSSYNTPVDNSFKEPYDEKKDMAKSGGTRYDSVPQWIFENVTRRYMKCGFEKDSTAVKGKMGAGAAKKKGVNVWYSEKVAKSYYLTGHRVRYAADGTKVSDPYFAQLTWGGTALLTLNRLVQSVSNEIRLRALTDGSWLMFTASEASDPEKFSLGDWYEYNSALPQTQPSNKGGEISPASVGLSKVIGGWAAIASAVREGTSGAFSAAKALLSLAAKEELPAVYNITQDAMCTISCPFSSFIPNFSKVHFTAGYTKNSLVNYFAGGGDNANEFTVLWQDVSFATVDDVNEMRLVCAGRSGEKK